MEINDLKVNHGPIPPGGEEYPFYRKGMTPEEWETEREYHIAHFQEWIDGTYQPLWKQALNKESSN